VEAFWGSSEPDALVGDRRAAQRGAARLAAAALERRIAALPSDTRRPPAVDAYDDLLPSRRPARSPAHDAR
jgi:hypothetical protein